MTGMSTQAAIRPALPAISVMVSRPTSGRPMRAAEVPNPVMYTAGNPASSTSRADNGSKAPGATMVWPESSKARSRAAPPGRRVSRAVTRRPGPALARLAPDGHRPARMPPRLHSKPYGAGTARPADQGGHLDQEQPRVDHAADLGTERLRRLEITRHG